MPTVNISETAAMMGQTVKKNRSIPGETGIQIAKTYNPAKVGQLTTRTDNTTGTLTMASGHGIVNANRVDIYWPGGYRGNVLVGTVSVNSVPISGGQGNNLPVNLTGVTVMVQNPETSGWVFAGSNLQALMMCCDVPFIATFFLADGTTVGFMFPFTDINGPGFIWEVIEGTMLSENPLSGMSIGKVSVTHNDSVNARKITVMALVN